MSVTSLVGQFKLASFDFLNQRLRFLLFLHQTGRGLADVEKALNLFTPTLSLETHDAAAIDGSLHPIAGTAHERPLQEELSLYHYNSLPVIWDYPQEETNPLPEFSWGPSISAFAQAALKKYFQSNGALVERAVRGWFSINPDETILYIVREASNNEFQFPHHHNTFQINAAVRRDGSLHVAGSIEIHPDIACFSSGECVINGSIIKK
ncbi:MAG: hypothetical protein HY921_02140 [Elusimicrobia bacterium]|nr:hypothetical protein [Elusimicrobiota bacterium]